MASNGKVAETHECPNGCGRRIMWFRTMCFPCELKLKNRARSFIDTKFQFPTRRHYR